MNRMKIDQKYGNNRISMLIEHWKCLKSMLDRNNYSYQEYINSKAIMFKSLYRKRKMLNAK